MEELTTPSNDVRLPVPERVRIRELAAWGLDENPYRPPVERIRNDEAGIAPFAPGDAILIDIPDQVSSLLRAQLHRLDLQAEMAGLDWTVGVVDLRQLLAFQRRLLFDDQLPHASIPAQDDWQALTALAFGPPIPVVYRTVVSNESELLLQSDNPNLQLRPSLDFPSHLHQLHGGSPFLEVASYRGRWFLRDGYHRSYRLLRAGIVYLPTVIVRARTLAELGPVQPWFFPEETLFSDRPPRMIDFLDDDLTIEFTRPRLLKTIRMTITESVEPAHTTQTSGEQQ